MNLRSIRFRICASVVIPWLLTGCVSKKSNSIDTQINLRSTYLSEQKKIHPDIQGIWKSIGNGYYLEARKDSILLYSYTNRFCYKEKNDYLEGLLNAESHFNLRGDTLEIYLTDFGEKTRFLQTRKNFVKVDRLPSESMSFSEMTALDPEILFELYLETLQENYAFQKERNLDGESLGAAYIDSIPIDRENLFQSIGEIATLTRDQHTKVISETGKQMQYRITPSAEIVKEAFEEQSEISQLNEYFDLFFRTNFKNISDSLLHGTGFKRANDQLEWGHLTDHIGYLNVHSFSGFLDRGFTRKQQIDSLNVYMQEIMMAFKDKEAIVVDVSFNFGGYDAPALTIASYFTRVPVFSHNSQVYSNLHFYHEDEVIVYPADSAVFTKPVYVLTTDISRSAAEGFAMMMDALPNAKLVGTNTLGTLSGMLGKSIGNYYTTFSNQKLVNEKNEYFEVKGVQPDIPLKVFQKSNIMQSHKMAVQELIKIIEEENNIQG